MTPTIGAPSADKPLVIQMTTVPVSLNYYAGRAQYLTRNGYRVEGVSSPGPELDEFADREGVPVHAVPMTRSISPLADAVSLARLVSLFARRRPTIVHAHTPKADLLGSLAARLTRTPAVVVSLFGLPQMTQTGWRRWVLDATTRVACRASDLVWCDSRSMQRHVTQSGLGRADQVRVLARGSANGVDAADRFNPDRYPSTRRRALREAVGVPADATVLGFVGRVVGDKGIHELEACWRRVRRERPDTRLMIVGPWEDKDRVDHAVERRLRNDPRVHIAGQQPDVPTQLAMMDLFVFPSYREGCPTAVLEASAMGLPIVSTEVPGCTDAVRPGVTGILVPARDADALTTAVREYVDNRELRSRHGDAGRRWVLDRFQPRGVWAAVAAVYRELLPDGAAPAAQRKPARAA